MIRDIGRLCLTLGLVLCPLLLGVALAKQPVDLRQRVDATAVRNMSARDMEMVAYSQHPGLEKWRHWQLKTQHPDTGEYLACYTPANAENCQTFGSYSEYLNFRIHAFYDVDRRQFFHDTGHPGLMDGASFQENTTPQTGHYH